MAVLGGLTVCARRIGEVLLVTAGGLFTLSNARELRTFVRLEVQREDARAAIVDMRGAVHLLTEEGWTHLAADSVAAARETKAIRLPVAIVVDAGAIGPMRVHCRSLAKHGLLRMAFTEYARASSWASRRMEHWESLPAPPSH